MMADTDLEPWQMTPSQYQARKGVHQPWIAEISPFQHAGMSKRQKRTYDTKRAAEWQASADVKTKWQQEVLEAYERGEFTLDDIPFESEAHTAIWYVLEDRRKAQVEQALNDAQRLSIIHSVNDLEIGDRVYDLMCGMYGTVTRKHKVSVRVKFSNGWEFKENVKALQWLHYNELKQAVENGDPIRPARLDKKGAE